MEPGLVTALRSKWLAATVHLALWALLALVIINYKGSAPPYRDVTSYSLPMQSPAPVARVDQLLALGKWPAVVIDTNAPSPFYTIAFIPAPKPPPKPAPPPPTTQKVTVVYQGFYLSGDGPQTAMVKVLDGFVMTAIGTPLVTNHFVAALTYNTMTLTNAAGQTNLLLLNTAKELEIPIK